MNKLYLLRTLLLVITSSLFAQNGIVDCTQVIKSDILKRDMNYSVYLPNGYNESNRSYPVLYLLHGMWGDNTDWVIKGEVNRITSSLISKGETPEMIIIMPNGLIDGFYINNYDGSVRWEDFFYEEFIPQVEEKYRILKNRNNRAIAGLSMGGYGALYNAITHKEMFKTCYALSAAVLEVEPQKKGDKRSANDKAFQTKLWGPLNKRGLPFNFKKYSIQEFFMAMDKYETPNPFAFGKEVGLPSITLDCGDDDFLLKQNTNLVHIMKSKDVPFDLRIREGGHTWEYWRTGLDLALKSIGSNFRN